MGLSLTGLFFPLLQPMLRVGGDPAVRQQGFQGGGVAGAMPHADLRRVASRMPFDLRTVRRFYYRK